MNHNHFGKVLDILIAVNIMFLIPILYFGQKSDAVIQNRVETVTYETIDTITTNGSISRDLYQTYQKKLATTNQVYDIVLEAKQRSLEPEYRFKTADEIIGEGLASWNGSNNYNYVPAQTSPPTVVENVDLTGLNTETNASVLAKGIMGNGVGHVHNEDCYDGHVHGGSKLFPHNHAHTNNCKEYVSTLYMFYNCYSCGNEFGRLASAYYWDETSNSSKSSYQQPGPLTCAHCNSSNVSGSIRYITGYGYSCGYDAPGDEYGNSPKRSYNVSYEYFRPQPQNPGKIDFQTGCYAYHQSSGLTQYELVVNAYGQMVYKSDLLGVVSALNNGKHSDYCTAPRDYRFMLRAYDSNVALTVFYTADVQADGRFMLRLVSTSNISGATFPELITLDQALTFFNTKTGYLAALSSYSTENINWIRQDYDYVETSMVSSYYVCDHTIVNRWYEICGYPSVYEPECNGNLTLKKSGVVNLVEMGWEYFSVDYHMYDCDSCTKGIFTVNFSLYGGPISNSMYWIGEYEDSRLNSMVTQIQSIKNATDHGMVRGLFLNGQRVLVYSQDNVENYIHQLLGYNAPILRVNDSTYNNDYLQLTNTGTNYSSYYLTRKVQNGSVVNKPLRHKNHMTLNVLGGNLICNQLVDRIAATHKIQGVYQNDSIIHTVTVYYKDGSYKVFLGDTTYRSNVIGSNQTATITYYGRASKDSHRTFSDTTTIRVIPRSKFCVNGHSYKVHGNGVDPGCIYCKEWVKTLQVTRPADKKLTIFRGKTLEESDVILLATYYDGRTEILRSGYVHNLDKFYVGNQTVTVSYKGKYDTIQVITKVNVKQCSVCNRYYDLMPDDSDGGCPYCASQVPIFTGNVMEYYSVISHDEIMTILYDQSGKLKLKTGDFVQIKIRNKSNTLSMNLLERLLGFSHSISFDYGSKIRDTRND